MLAHADVGTTLPMSSPYLMTVSPFLSALSATLWPIGMSCLALSFMVSSLSVITHMPVPAFRPSTTTTDIVLGELEAKCGTLMRSPLLCSAHASMLYGVNSYKIWTMVNEMF